MPQRRVSLGGGDPNPGGGVEVVALAVQRMRLRRLGRQRAEGVEPDVERHPFHLEPGELIGEISALARYAVSGDVVAKSDVVCLVIRTPALRMLFKQKELAEFKEKGEPARQVLRVGAGPGGITVKATSTQTIESEAVAVAVAVSLVGFSLAGAISTVWLGSPAHDYLSTDVVHASPYDYESTGTVSGGTAPVAAGWDTDENGLLDVSGTSFTGTVNRTRTKALALTFCIAVCRDACGSGSSGPANLNVPAAERFAGPPSMLGGKVPAPPGQAEPTKLNAPLPDCVSHGSGGRLMPKFPFRSPTP